MFTPPPLDGTLTVDQFYDWHRVHSRDAVAFVFPKQDGRQDTLTWKQLGEGIINGVEIIQNHIPKIKVESDLLSHQEPIIVGILATVDIVTYTTFLLSHIRLSHPDSSRSPVIPFPISPRNSAAAVAHLLSTTNVKYVWVTEGPMRTLLDEALQQNGVEDTVIIPCPSFSDLYRGSPGNLSPTLNIKNKGVTVSLDQPALILHSSGSAAFPNPRTLTHRILFEGSQTFKYSGLKLEDETMAVHGTPLFHAMGVYSACWAAVSGQRRAAATPGVAQPPLTPAFFLQQAIESNSTMLFCVPSFLEAWSADSDCLRDLKKLKIIFWGGGPLREDVGRFLYKESVGIRVVYGATEFGSVTVASATRYPEGYEWFEFMPKTMPELIPQEEDESVYEVVFKESELHHMTNYNTQVDGKPGYATSDLVERHKSNPNLFRLLGRKDDQIMLSTGEKTNPGPIEFNIVKDSHVKNAIMFGRERLSTGVLIEPVSYEEAKRLGVEKFRNLIWPSIEYANGFAPAHSRIFKEMILIASPSKPLSFTSKLTPRRGIILKDYAQEIDAIYQAVEDSSSTNVPIPPGSSVEGGWTLDESLGFIRDVVHSIMKGAGTMKDEDDIFIFGCDSLQATHIRNTVLHALRQVGPLAKVQMVLSNVVYQHPTIRDLAAFAAKVSHSANSSVDLDAGEAREQRLLKLVGKYSGGWPLHRPAKDAINPTDETILLTGSTGGLGSQLLAQLVSMPSVSRIYAFNRPAQKSSRDRHLEAFLARGNDVALLDSEKLVYVEGDADVEGFNIQPALFAEMCQSITVIIHNAWRVDFNLSTSSFEPAIQGVRHMIDLALQSPHPSPPRVMFTSSVGIVKASPGVPRVAESPFTDLTDVNVSGYSESKWVSERILWAACQETPLRPVIIRVGQLCGGINGNWNHKEWFPAMVTACRVLGGLPSNRGLVSFVPLHVAASAIIELRHTSSNFVHLVHPRPVLWDVIIGHVSEALQVPLIPYDEWLTRLEAVPRTDEDLHRNPALHLIDFYRESLSPKVPQGVDEKEAIGLAMFDTTATSTDAPSLGPSRLAQLGKADVELWISYWRSTGALDV